MNTKPNSARLDPQERRSERAAATTSQPAPPRTISTFQPAGAVMARIVAGLVK